MIAFAINRAHWLLISISISVAQPGNVHLVQRVRLGLERDEFVAEAAMLQAVVQVEFAGLKALANLTVQPELVAIGVQAARLAVRVEPQQIRLQSLGQRCLWAFGQRTL